MSKAGKMGDASKKGVARKRFEIGTDNKCIRVLNITEGKRRFVWAVEEGGGYRHVPIHMTELR